MNELYCSTLHFTSYHRVMQCHVMLCNLTLSFLDFFLMLFQMLFQILTNCFISDGIEASSSTSGIRNRYSNNATGGDSKIPSFSGSMSSLQNDNQQNNSSSLPVYTPLDIQQMEEQSGQAQMMQLIPDQNYLRERADAMEAVETNIVELGTIFNKLAVMVNEHSEMVTRVEDNVDSANENLTLSMKTLTDTLDNLRSNRALFFKVFSIFVAFIIFFIVFFA
jgi:hypothetical protein